MMGHFCCAECWPAFSRDSSRSASARSTANLRSSGPSLSRSAIDQAKGEAPEPEIVSRATQSSIGLLTAGVLYGAGLGGFFALAFAFAHGRIGDFGPRVSAFAVASAAFVTVALVPMLKYPANPPSVGDPETIGQRTALFFALVALSVAAAITAALVNGRLRQRIGSWWAGVAATGLFIAVIGVAFAVLPAVNEVPETFPAVTLWNFRLASLGMQAVVWSTLALVFGWLAEALLQPHQAVTRSA